MLGAGLRTDQLQNSLWNVREQQITVFFENIGNTKITQNHGFFTGFHGLFTGFSRSFHGFRFDHNFHHSSVKIVIFNDTLRIIANELWYDLKVQWEIGDKSTTLNLGFDELLHRIPARMVPVVGSDFLAGGPLHQVQKTVPL